MTLTAAVAPDAAWSPLSQQFVENDTTFLFDPDADTAAGYLPGTGAMVPRRDVTMPAYVAGKFRKGFAAANNQQLLWIPCDGILGTAEFTIEGWFQNTADWFTLAGTNLPFSVGTSTSGVKFTLNQGGKDIAVLAQHTQNPASPSSYSKIAQVTISSGQYPANTWVHLAATLKSGTLTLYVNGAVAATATNFVSPDYWGSTSRDEGVTIGGASGTGLVGWTVSDVRISRRARVPNRAPIAPSRSTITVSATTTGATVQKLNGALHGITTPGGSLQPAAAPIQAALQGLKVVRTDKLLNTTPIKAGGTDGTHPTAGHSGSFSYDWQVVDRSLAYIIDTLGCEPYISLDSTPQILGGGSAPFSGSQLTSGYAYQGAYNGQVPNNFSSFATIAADCVYHCLTELGRTIPYWGLWNEPAGSDWAGTLIQYLNLYGSVAAAVKAVAPTIKFGGHEDSWLNLSARVQALVYYCGTLPAPTGVTAASQVGGGTFNGATTRFYKAVYRNGSGNSVGSNEVSATPANGGSVLLTLPYQPGATTIDVYAASSSGGQNGATSLLVSGIVAGDQASATYTDTGAALTTGSIPASATASGVPLDFIAWHWYDGDPSEPAQISAQVAAWATTAGITAPPLICGETAWSNTTAGYWPWFQHPTPIGNDPGPDSAVAVNYLLNDWGAAYLGNQFIRSQKNGVIRIINNDFLNNASSDNYFNPSTATPESQYNVCRLWSMLLGLQVLQDTVDLDPGVHRLVCKDPGSGKVYAFLVSLHYRKDKNYPVLVNVSALKPDGTPVTAYVVDDGHSNNFDTGGAAFALQTVSTNPATAGVANTVQNGVVGLNLRPRSTALLAVG